MDRGCDSPKAEVEAKIAAMQEQEKQTGRNPRGRAPQVHNPEYIFRGAPDVVKKEMVVNRRQHRLR
jgi:hypothetical protein